MIGFLPALPLGGFAGLKVLDRTRPIQQAAFDRQPSIRRDTDYFRERIGAIDSAEELVADRRLLRVALGAFGLQDDINNRFFIRKVLEDGTLTPGALSLRLSDTRYREFSAAFGFGDLSTPRNKLSDFPDRIIAAFQERSFEVAVGEVDDTLRLALNARRELAALAGKVQSDPAKWFSLMGQPSLRRVMEGALGLPESFGRIDLEKQREIFQDKLQRLLGDPTIGQFADGDKVEKLIRRFLLRADAAQSLQFSSPGANALVLLQNAAPIRRSAF